MKQVWQAFDGEIFYDEISCAEYEKEHIGQLQMWDRDGRRVTEPSHAFFVFFSDDTQAQTFINACIAANDDHTGIEDGLMGLFFWDEWDAKYIYFDTDLANGMYKVLAEIG